MSPSESSTSLSPPVSISFDKPPWKLPDSTLVSSDSASYASQVNRRHLLELPFTFMMGGIGRQSSDNSAVEYNDHVLNVTFSRKLLFTVNIINIAFDGAV